MEVEKILIAEADFRVAELASIKLSNAGFLIITATDGQKAIEKALNNYPDLLLVGLDLPGKGALEVCGELKMDPRFSSTPIVLIVDQYFDDTKINNIRFKIDDLLVKPFTPKILLGKVNTSLLKYRLVKHLNPKTLLPGKIHLQDEVEILIREGCHFDLVFCDLRSFGIYNKIYGFSQGDAVIKFVAELLQKTLYEQNLGAELFHLGGDDFAILARETIPEVFYKKLSEYYENGILQFYREEDAERGGLVFNNRRGLVEQSPIMALDLAAVSNRRRQINNWLETETIGEELIKYSKTFPGSSWVKDRRSS